MPRPSTGTVAFKNGRWWARLTTRDKDGNETRPWVDPGRPDIPNTPRGKTEAKKLAQEANPLARGGVFLGRDHVEETSEPETIATLVTRWIKLLDSDADSMAKATRYGHKSIINGHVVPALGDEQPPLTIPQLRSFFRELKTKREASTVRNVANTMTRWWENLGRLPGLTPFKDLLVDRARIRLPGERAPQGQLRVG